MSTKVKENIEQVNAVLAMLSKDEDLHDDLKLPQVATAINHWTGQKRLPPEKAQLLQNDRRIVYVLQRFQMLQSVCVRAGMPVPLDHLVSRWPKLQDALVEAQFGKNYLDKDTSSEKLMQSSPGSSGKCEVSCTTGRSVDLPAVGSENLSGPSSTGAAADKSSAITGSEYNVNFVLKVAIAVIFVFIGIIWFHLLS